MSLPQRRRIVASGRKTIELISIKIVVAPDPYPDISYLEEQEEFEERLVAYNKDEFQLVYVRAEAEVAITGVIQTLGSGGLYGVESDLEKPELDEIAGNEWTALRTILKIVGVSTDKLPLEIGGDWMEWRT